MNKLFKIFDAMEAKRDIEASLVASGEVARTVTQSYVQRVRN